MHSLRLITVVHTLVAVRACWCLAACMPHCPCPPCPDARMGQAMSAEPNKGTQRACQQQTNPCSINDAPCWAAYFGFWPLVTDADLLDEYDFHLSREPCICTVYLKSTTIVGGGPYDWTWGGSIDPSVA